MHWSIRLYFCRSVPPEFLRSFLYDDDDGDDDDEDDDLAQLIRSEDDTGNF